MDDLHNFNKLSDDDRERIMIKWCRENKKECANMTDKEILDFLDNQTND